MAKILARSWSVFGSAVIGLAVLTSTPAHAGTDTSYEYTWWGAYGEAQCIEERDAQHNPQGGTWAYGCTYYPANAVYSGSEAGWYFITRVSLD